MIPNCNSYIGDPVAWRVHQLEALLGKLCYGGLDLGVVNDFTCLALYFPKQKGVAKAVLLLWAWGPDDVKHHEILKERYGYHEWVRGGFVIVTPGNRTDYAFVREAVVKLDKEYVIEELA